MTSQNTPPSSSELLPCPFKCGGKAYRHEADLEIVNAVAIGCDMCGALGPFIDLYGYDDDKEKAFTAAEKAWNTRAKDTPQGDEQGFVIPPELYHFLMGEGPLDGTWFTEMNKNIPGRHWWRALLSTCKPAALVRSKPDDVPLESVDDWRCVNCKRIMKASDEADR